MPKQVKSKDVKDREIIHPKRKAKFYTKEEGNPITVKLMKKWLDWEEEENDKYGEDYLLKDCYGKKIRCYNNLSNRPFDKRLCKMLKQETLRRNWKINGESIVIGTTGMFLSGQHRGVGLILAAQEVELDPDKWEWGEEEPYLESLIAFGISEDDDVVNTLDTGKARSLSDVIYRSNVFANADAKERKQASRMVEHAVRLLWDRTGASDDAYSPSLIRTHMESLYFIDLHPKLIDCVEHIYAENTEKRITKYIGPGYASGLLYLMGCSASDPDAYRKNDPPMEELLDWQHWEKACDFWVCIDTKELSPLRKALVEIQNSGGGSPAEQRALIVKAWNSYLKNGRVTSKNLELKYQMDEDGIKVLDDYPTVGGIDVDKSEEAVTTVKVIEERKQKERIKRENGDKAKKKQPPKGKTAPRPKIGDEVWIDEEDGPIYGTLRSKSGSMAMVYVHDVGNMEFPYSLVFLGEPLNLE